ncbi:transmembrane protein 139 [Tenrec ecaudatus]|uniref:transmembrane protein 139 n=1 Tax=Tenrec ecaudatus TaxID=94439 RepID=UPI003F5971DF
MVPGQQWGHLKKPLFFLGGTFSLLGLALLGIWPAAAPGVAYFLLVLGGFCGFAYLGACVLEHRMHSVQAGSRGSSVSMWDNEAFEVPVYQAATALGPPCDPQEWENPPSYSSVYPLGLNVDERSHPEAPRRVGLARRGGSEGCLRRAPVSLRLRGARTVSTDPDLQTLGMAPKLEPLTPPPGYEVSLSHLDDDSVFYEDNRAVP